MKIGCVRTTVYAYVLLTSALALATEEFLKPPTWPQDFSVAPKEHTLAVSSWSNTHIVARTPALTGFANPQNCKVYVKNKVGKSDQKPLVLKPGLTTTILFMTEVLSSGESSFTSRGPEDQFTVVPSPAAPLWLSGYQRAGTFEGHRGDDEFFLKRKLRNGWVVESVDFTQQRARLEVSRVGTDSPYLKIHWWCDAPWQTASYTVKIIVKGPKGTMY